ncbi:hypothetical protein ACI2LJ_19560 [Streptomyces sp. NPDC088090]|uniref:hypothetical protein n=1 Tax=Streptomyces sp. NPDC088090 TaxID=3365822 RepID=UPI00384D0A86
MSLGHIVLSTGRRIRLDEVWMSSTYGGMLEGYPHRRVNDWKVDWLRKRAERTYSSMAVHLVPPGRAYPDRAAGPSGPIELLPAVMCVGAFDSAPLDGAMDGSSLVVAWFQHEPRVPAGEDADAGLRGIRWEELARDYEL